MYRLQVCAFGSVVQVFWGLSNQQCIAGHHPARIASTNLELPLSRASQSRLRCKIARQRQESRHSRSRGSCNFSRLVVTPPRRKDPTSQGGRGEGIFPTGSDKTIWRFPQIRGPHIEPQVVGLSFKDTHPKDTQFVETAIWIASSSSSSKALEKSPSKRPASGGGGGRAAHTGGCHQ